MVPDSWARAEWVQTFSGRRCRAGLCRHTPLTLTSRKPVSGSTLLRLISIIREDVRGEAALISLSKAPCQLGNLCTGLMMHNSMYPL